MKVSPFRGSEIKFPTRFSVSPEWVVIRQNFEEGTNIWKDTVGLNKTAMRHLIALWNKVNEG
jgi:hypothetical protein